MRSLAPYLMDHVQPVNNEQFLLIPSGAHVIADKLAITHKILQDFKPSHDNIWYTTKIAFTHENICIIRESSIPIYLLRTPEELLRHQRAAYDACLLVGVMECSILCFPSVMERTHADILDNLHDIAEHDSSL